MASWSTSKRAADSMSPPASLAGPSSGLGGVARDFVSTIGDALNPFSTDPAAEELGLNETAWNPSETSAQPMFSPEEQSALGGGWHQMASSNVDEIRYLMAERILEVIFHNNYHYSYFNVPASVYLDFLKTDSPGRFVWRVLRADGYEYARIGSGVIPVFPTGNVTRTANVMRPLLPEEREGNREKLATLPAGGSVKMTPVRLKQANWRAENVKATPAQVRARNKARLGK